MGNPLIEKSEDLAVRIVGLHNFLKREKKEFCMSKQLLRSGTSVGANIAEAHHAQSDADFIAKLHISLKECAESLFWIKILFRTNYLTDSQYGSIKADLDSIYALLTTVIKKVKDRIKNEGVF